MHGSLINRLSEGKTAVKPEVGMGATELCYSDRHAYTIVEVSPSGKTIKVQPDKATRTDNNGMSDAQTYSFEPDTNAPIITVRLTKKGWQSKGRPFAIGYRSEHYDYTF